jgi:hypothetical protein
MIGCGTELCGLHSDQFLFIVALSRLRRRFSWNCLAGRSRVLLPSSFLSAMLPLSERLLTALACWSIIGAGELIWRIYCWLLP